METNRIKERLLKMYSLATQRGKQDKKVRNLEAELEEDGGLG